MPSLWVIIGLDVLAVLIVETVLWRLFVRRVQPLLLARELDASSFGLWSVGRMRVFVVMHTLLLGGSTVAFLLSVW